MEGGGWDWPSSSGPPLLPHRMDLRMGAGMPPPSPPHNLGIGMGMGMGMDRPPPGRGRGRGGRWSPGGPGLHNMAMGELALLGGEANGGPVLGDGFDPRMGGPPMMMDGMGEGMPGQPPFGMPPGPGMIGMLGSGGRGGMRMPPGGGMGYGFNGGGDFSGRGFDRGGHAGQRGRFDGGRRGGGRFDDRGVGRGRSGGQQNLSWSKREAKDQNDYSQHFVDTGQRPQNSLRDAHLTDRDRFAEYPRLRDLVEAKDRLVRMSATPPFFLKADLKELKLSVETFGTKFDVILIDPPWEEYVRRAPGVGDGIAWTWQEIMALEIENIADSPSFVFLWCGSAEGLDAGRHCLKKWGFRRCEDICWIKTNKDSQRKYRLRQDAGSVLQHTKEHCLMGIRGSVRRTPDGHIIHANVDTDIIISDEPEFGSNEKPEELYFIIEHFAQGMRRLELFGGDNNIRPGWVTVGKDLTSSNFSPEVYASHFRLPDGSVYITHPGGARCPPPGYPHLLPQTPDVEELRPRSPPRGDRK